MSLTRDEAIGLISVTVEAVTEELATKIEALTQRFENLSPRVETFEPVSIPDNSRGNSLDLIKSLPEFKGDVQSYPAWRDAAHFAMRYYPEDTENYYIAIGVFRNKITGMANAKLASFNTVLNFNAIIARLDQCYADKRSLQALENELSVLRQGELAISEFYDLVDEHLTLIINKNKMTYSSNEEVAIALNERARDNALRVFISGLRRPLSNILFSARPADLPTALATAQELEADHKRQQFARIFAAGDSARSSQYQVRKLGGLPATHPSYRPKREKDLGPKDGESTNPIPMDVDRGSSLFRRPTAYAAQQQPRPTTNQNRQQHSQGNVIKRRYENSGISAPAPKAQRVNYIEVGNSEEQEDIDSVFEYEQEDEEDEIVEEQLNFLG